MNSRWDRWHFDLIVSLVFAVSVGVILVMSFIAIELSKH